MSQIPPDEIYENFEELYTNIRRHSIASVQQRDSSFALQCVTNLDTLTAQVHVLHSIHKKCMEQIQRVKNEIMEHYQLQDSTATEEETNNCDKNNKKIRKTRQKSTSSTPSKVSNNNNDIRDKNNWDRELLSENVLMFSYQQKNMFYMSYDDNEIARLYAARIYNKHDVIGVIHGFKRTNLTSYNSKTECYLKYIAVEGRWVNCEKGNKTGCLIGTCRMVSDNTPSANISIDKYGVCKALKRIEKDVELILTKDYSPEFFEIYDEAKDDDNSDSDDSNDDSNDDNVDDDKKSPNENSAKDTEDDDNIESDDDDKTSPSEDTDTQDNDNIESDEDESNTQEQTEKTIVATINSNASVNTDAAKKHTVIKKRLFNETTNSNHSPTQEDVDDAAHQLKKLKTSI